jgi:hypothetical protein
MTDKILEMAKEAGFELDNNAGTVQFVWVEQLEAFANLIEAKARADEREKFEVRDYDYHGQPLYSKKG